MKLAAVDIGSNAIRMQVTNVIEYDNDVVFKKLEYIRFPLRLGHDVFSQGQISEKTSLKFIKLMKAFKLFIDLYEVDDYMACATSAMREASNGEELKKKVKEETGLEITIIEGDTEAELINRAVNTHITDAPFLHIDVGGGSTELNVYLQREKVASRSFRLGGVRRLDKKDSPEVWKEMKAWIEEKIPIRSQKITALGTGGNISKIFELAGIKKGKKLSYEKAQEVVERLSQLTLEERIFKLQLNHDRADVIIPASEIYLGAMKAAHARYIIVPDVGLKDGVMHYLFEKNKHRIAPYIVKSSW